jgi:hypothetical protein
MREREDEGEEKGRLRRGRRRWRRREKKDGVFIEGRWRKDGR